MAHVVLVSHEMLGTRNGTTSLILDPFIWHLSDHIISPWALAVPLLVPPPLDPAMIQACSSCLLFCRDTRHQSMRRAALSSWSGVLVRRGVCLRRGAKAEVGLGTESQGSRQVPGLVGLGTWACRMTCDGLVYMSAHAQVTISYALVMIPDWKAAVKLLTSRASGVHYFLARLDLSRAVFWVVEGRRGAGWHVRGGT